MNDKHFGVMVDCSRNAVYSVSGVKKLIDVLSKMGYNTLMLYTEDTYEVDNQPRFGYLRGRYTKNELKELVVYGEENGIELVPCIQTLAHLNQIFRWKEYAEINDCADILLAGDDRTYVLIEDMFKTIRECFRSKLVHIGMDEAHGLGKGKYRDINGDKNRFDILKEHLAKVSKIAEKYNFKPLMWSDMFFRLANNGEYYTEDPSIITAEMTENVPENVELVYWDYYSDKKQNVDAMIDAHRHFDNNLWFAGGAWTWVGFAPRNRASIIGAKLAMESCREKNVDNIFMTCWGDDGGECSVFSVLPTLFYAAEIYRGNTDDNLIKANFKDVFDIDFDDFLNLDLPSAPTDEWLEKLPGLSLTFLYLDPFMGWLDPTIEQSFASLDEVRRNYETNAEILKKNQSDKEFGYLFKYMSALCSALALKFDLGIKTRRAYKNKKELPELIKVYKELEERLDDFYEAFREAWYKDKKGSGFEVQDIRLGGLEKRVKSCRCLLESYMNCEIDIIDDLEQELIDPNEQLRTIHWLLNSTTNKIGWNSN